jgi:hypothetical protein
VTLSNGHLDPETALKADRPTQTLETGIQTGAAGGTAVPPGLQHPAFVQRIRELHELHTRLSTTRANPAMWPLVQLGCFFMGGAAAFGMYQAMVTGGAEQDVAAVGFVVAFFVVLLAPDALLWLGRRSQKIVARHQLLECISMTCRLYPEEVSHCGGLRVLADRLEVEALLTVLEARYPSEEQNRPAM